MGDSEGKSDSVIFVREMWWEGEDFHTIDVNGSHVVYKEARLVDSSICEPEPEDGSESARFTYTAKVNRDGN